MMVFEAQRLPEGEINFQLIEGSGLPLAWHIRVTLEPSFTTRPLEKLMIFGGTVKEDWGKREERKRSYFFEEHSECHWFHY